MVSNLSSVQVKNSILLKENFYEEYLKYCLKFWAEQGFNIPGSVDEGLKYKPKPHYFTYKSSKNWFGKDLLQVLHDIYSLQGIDFEVANSNTSSKEKLSNSKIEEATLLNIVEEVDGKVLYKCTKCSTLEKVDRATLLKWVKYSTKYCMSCRGTGRRLLSTSDKLEKYKAEIPELFYRWIDIISFTPSKELGSKHSLCTVLFKETNETKQYNANTLKSILKSGRAIAPNNHNSAGVSMMELWALDIISSITEEYSYQVPYSTVGTCESNWTSDFKIKNTLIEITTKTGLEVPRNKQKQLWASKNNINLKFITNLLELEDIVRTLVKAKEL